MKTIQVEELEQLSADEIQVIDLRPEEEYKRGSFPGAVNLPMEEFDSRYEEVLEKEKPIYFICHTVVLENFYCLFSLYLNSLYRIIFIN